MVRLSDGVSEAQPVDARSVRGQDRIVGRRGMLLYPFEQRRAVVERDPLERVDDADNAIVAATSR